MSLHLLNKKCSKCGASVSQDAKFCPVCGAPQDSAKVVCGNCQNTVPAAAKFCPKCGAPLGSQVHPTLSGNRWVRRDGDFATRVEVQNIPGFIKQELIVEPGTNALLIINGETRGVCPPGKYTLDTLGDKIGRIISLDWAHSITALLTDVTPVELQYDETRLNDLFTKDGFRVNVSARLITEIENPVFFMTTLMKERRNYRLEVLAGYLESEVTALSEEWVGQQTLSDLAHNLRLKEAYALHLEEGLRRTFIRNGLIFRDARAIRFTHEHLDAQRRQREVLLLQATQAEGELDGRRRLADVQHQLDLQKVSEEEQKAALHERMRRAVLSDKMSEVRSEEEFEQFLDGIDRQKLLRDKERQELLDIWKAEAADHDRARAHVAAKLDVERKYELDLARLKGDNTLKGEQQEFEIQLARKKADFELDLARQKWAEELKIESDKRQQALERARLQGELEALQREQERGDAMLGLEILGKMKELRRLDEAEKLRIGREDMFARQKVEWEQQVQVFELEERRRASEREFELKRLTQLSAMSIEGLIAASPKEQAELLADLKKTETLKGMTEEQILAAAAEKSPEVARAFQEKFRAIAQGKASEREREMYEHFLGEKDKASAEMLRQMREMARDQRELAETALKQMAEVARGAGGATPVVVSGGGSVMRGRLVNQDDVADSQRTCPNCGLRVDREAAFCPECGHKFPSGR